MEEKKNKEWEKMTIEKIAMESFAQQKKSRLWGIIFKSISLFYIGLILFFILTTSNTGSMVSGDFTALIRLDGEISNDSEVSSFKLM